MSQHSGFFNALVNNGVADRKYNAKDYNSNLGAIISNGVRRSADDDLKVVAGGEMKVNVKIGRAWIKGAWYYLDANYTFTVPASNIQLNRIDRIVVRYNATTAVRAISLQYLQGELASSPSPTAPTQTDDIYDLVLADIYVGAGRTSIQQSNITDRRADTSLCGWIRSPIGYDDYFTTLDNKATDHMEEYDAEWQTMKDNWASVTLYKQYTNRVQTTASGTTFDIGIAQYDHTGTDILNVYLNGFRAYLDDDYTISSDGKKVTFTSTILANQEILFEVYRSIDGTGLGSVADSVAQLEQDVADLQVLDEYSYVCNGLTDNVAISNLVNAWQTGGTDYGCLKLKIVGTFGATAPFSGDGTSTSRAKWIQAGQASAVNRQVILDFSACGQMSFPLVGGSDNIIFYGKDIHIIGASVLINQSEVGTKCVMFEAGDRSCQADDCRFYVTTYGSSWIADSGTFRQCRASVACSAGNAYCFKVGASGLIRIEGGEFYAFGGGSNQGIVLDNTAGGVAIAYGMNCPSSTRSGYTQTGAVNATGALTSLTDTMTKLTVTNASGNNRGLLSASLPNRM